MKSALLLDVVVGESPAVLQLLPSEDQPLLVGWDPLLVLNFRLDVLNGVAGLNLEGDGFAGQSLDEDLHPATESQDQVKSALLLDVVVGEGPSILELLPSEDQSLLVGWDSLLVLIKGMYQLNLLRAPTISVIPRY